MIIDKKECTDCARRIPFGSLYFNPANFSGRLVLISVDCLSTRLDTQILKPNILNYVKPQLVGFTA